MRYLKKILILFFLLLQINSYLHLSEHGHEGEHKNEENCEIVLHLNHFVADDSIDLAVQVHLFEKEIFAISAYENQISKFKKKPYFSRAPPQLS